MHKKKIGGLAVLMAISLLGIIWVQTVWVKNAFETRRFLFENAVQRSLGQAAGRIEMNNRFRFFNNYMGNDTLSKSYRSHTVNQNISPGAESGSYSIRIYQDGNNEPRVMLNDSILEGGISALTRIGDNSTNGQFEISISNQGDNNNVNIHSQEYINWVERRSDEFLRLRNQMINEIYNWEESISLTDEEINNILSNELRQNGIFAPFKAGVFENGKLRNGSYNQTEKKELERSRFKSPLFADRIVRSDMLLSVVFPGEKKYIMGSMATIIGGSILFSTIIFLTFILSIYFILRQKRISEMKSDFINNMTHEFKTPLATISLAADTIVNPKVIADESRVKHFVEMIKKENLRMNKQVETILQIATLEKKEMEFNFEKISVHSVLMRAIETVSIQVEQKGGWINTEFNAVEDIVTGDFEHLTNLAHNLLDNANKYSSGPPEITIVTNSAQGGVIITVSDRGIGMSKSVQARIFERFYRESTGNIHNVKGFGLGLNYVRAIVDTHHGTIKVESEPGKGTLFTIFIPHNLEKA